MQTDEEQIRELVATWQRATQAGDTDQILKLMTDDVLFLRPGCTPMNRTEFENASRGVSSGLRPQIEMTSRIEEITVEGNMAYMWSHMAIRITPVSSSTTMQRAGHILTIFKKVDGCWLLHRDANMLTLVS